MKEDIEITKEGYAIIKQDSHIGQWVRESGRLDHDRSALPIILEHIPEGSIVFDIGANIGTHSIAYATKAKVLAFEPNIQAYECLSYNMQSVQDVYCANIAFSDSVYPYFIKGNQNIGMAQVVYAEEGTHKTMTIDQYCKDWDVLPDVIKIDAEGMETRILKGAKNVIRIKSPVLVLEVNEQALLEQGSSRKELFDLLDSFSYTYKDIYDQDITTLKSQFDIVCYKQ